MSLEKTLKQQVSHNWAHSHTANIWPQSSPQLPPGQGRDPATCQIPGDSCVLTTTPKDLVNPNKCWSMSQRWTVIGPRKSQTTLHLNVTSMSTTWDQKKLIKHVGPMISLSAVGFGASLKRLINHASLNFLTAFPAFIRVNCAAGEDKSRRSG